VDVLLAERSPVLRVRLARLLAELPGVRILAAVQTADEAREAAKAFQPQVVVLDLCLEGSGSSGGGIALLREMKMQNPLCRIIVLTDDPSPTLYARCREVADLCLDKTHEISILTEALRQQEQRIAWMTDDDSAGAD
jgi:two-component system, NarL family, response regulator LiaR